MKLIYPLDIQVPDKEQMIGSKAWTLAKLKSNGLPVQPGFCVSVSAYQQLVEKNHLQKIIQHEFHKKSILAMRWEELWDAAFRIRIAFTNSEFSTQFSQALAKALGQFQEAQAFAVRSSAIGEDTLQLSFAGIFSSLLNCASQIEVENAIKQVFASLWSEAAIMYRHELHYDFKSTAMAVLIQPMVEHAISGIAFSRDPRNPDSDSMIIECISGPTAALVSHQVEPNHYQLARNQCDLIETPRINNPSAELSTEDLRFLQTKILQIETLLGYPVDIEWTGLFEEFTILQARPITHISLKNKDERQYFLTLTPDLAQLEELSQEIQNNLLPSLTALGEQYAEMDLTQLSDPELSQEILKRQTSLFDWRLTYKNKFVPLAHAIRAFAEMYHQLVQPRDPYEFIGLLLNEERLTSCRNQMILDAANQLRQDPDLYLQLSSNQETDWLLIKKILQSKASGQTILTLIEKIDHDYLDVNFHRDRLIDHPEITFSVVMQLARNESKAEPSANIKEELLKRFFLYCPDQQKEQAKTLLNLARLSWRIRDDDDILLGKLESQLLRAIHIGLDRLYSEKKIIEIPASSITLANIVAQVLLSGELPLPYKLILNAPEQPRETLHQADFAPHTLFGQPAAPGMVVGKIRKIESINDMVSFQKGEVLACEFIDPVMTHLIMLASAIIESRGGMLVHSVIIARELGIPCVNGIANMLKNVENGQMVEVDGNQGIVRFL